MSSLILYAYYMKGKKYNICLESEKLNALKVLTS